MRLFQVGNASLAEQPGGAGRRAHHLLGADPAYLGHIEAYDRAGRASTRCARSIPTRSLSPPPRREKPRTRPLVGIPILVKDNIATADGEHTTAGSLALASARQEDATVVREPRAAGAVILGKANLTEFANFLAIDMPSGYTRWVAR